MPRGNIVNQLRFLITFTQHTAAIKTDRETTHNIDKYQNYLKMIVFMR